MSRTQRYRRGHPPTLHPEAQEFEVRALDGVRIRGAFLPPRAASEEAVVLCHGFLGSFRRPQNLRLGSLLASRFGVFMLDFRGHGSSGGQSTAGDLEALDVQAVVSLARERGFERVATIGASMGGIAVLREAARFADVDGVVSISAPGQWSGHGRVARLAGVLVTTATGRRFARLVFRTRVYPAWRWTPPPVEMIERIDVPVLVVHGTEDTFFPVSQAQVLFSRARSRRRLLVLEGFGHAELGYTPAFGRLIAREVDGMLTDHGWGDAGDPDRARRLPLPGAAG